MLWNRLIPVLLLHEGGLWKTERFKPRTYVGDPTNAVRIFNDKQVDELIVLDIDASKLGRGPDYAAVERLASECFMPLCYGGGVTSLSQAETLFQLGVEKVALNSVLLRRPDLITEIADFAGSQAVVAGIDVLRTHAKSSRYSHVAGAPVAGDWRAAVARFCALGAGEILVNAVAQDGTLAGPDLELVREAADNSTVPLISVGGVRDLADAAAVVGEGAAAVGAGAMFVYRGRHRAVLISYPDVEMVRAEQLLD